MIDSAEKWLGLFEKAKPRLVGLAYRILGSVAEAEDAVQDTFLKWQDADKNGLAKPEAWLTTVCTRRALDMLKAAHNSRVSYVGTWLPEPVLTEDVFQTDIEYELASNLSTAFLLMMERLSPKERAAYLLHDVFDGDYCDIAETLDMTEPAVRKLVSRARAHIGKEDARYLPEEEVQQRLLAVFQGAIETGDTEALALELAQDVRLHGDGGGKVIAVTRVLTEQKHILKFIRTVLSPNWAGSRVTMVPMNGQFGLVYRLDGKIHTVVTFSCNEQGDVSDLYLVRNPDKIALLEQRLSSV